MTPEELEELEVVLSDTFIDLIRFRILRGEGVAVEHPSDPYGLIDVILHNLTPLQLAKEVHSYINIMIEIDSDDLKERQKEQKTD